MRATGPPEERWWTGRADALAEPAPGFADRFPLVARLHAADPFAADPFAADSPDDGADGEGVPHLERAAREAFEGGLALVLDGIEAAVAGGSGRRV